MFLDELTADEKQAFLVLAKHLVNLDGNSQLSRQEEKVFARLYRELNLPKGDGKNDPSLVDSVNAFTTSRARHIALLELTALAHADEELHAREVRFLMEIAKSLSISPETIARMDAWVAAIKTHIDLADREFLTV